MSLLTQIMTKLTADAGFLLLVTGLFLSSSGCQNPDIVKEPLPLQPQHSIGREMFPIPASGGMAVKRVLDPNTPGLLKMNHKLHVIDQGMECSACHEVQTGGKASMPDHDSCSSCHDINMDEPSQDCAMCHNYSPESIQNASWMDVEVIHPDKKEGLKFDHTGVAADPNSCVGCHREAQKSEKPTDSLVGDHTNLFPQLRKSGMNPDNCALCHTNLSKQTIPDWHRSNDFVRVHGQMQDKIKQGMCAMCHTDKDCQACHQQTKPLSHERKEWVHQHGKVGKLDQKQCLLCHSEQSCQTCHQSTMPKDHTSFFRRRSHGKLATWNRERCLVCHKQDSCEACHIGAAPLITSWPFHTPSSDCLNCHSPASPVRPLRRHGPMPNNTCLKCHRFQ